MIPLVHPPETGLQVMYGCAAPMKQMSGGAFGDSGAGVTSLCQHAEQRYEGRFGRFYQTPGQVQK